jgi:16S rRNA (adenine1518-N6/adenine1519-N6)-dimethyltransferase
VPPQSFRPVPKVNSAIVRMIPLPPGKVSARDDEVFAEIVTAAFSQRRKTLRNTLKTYMTDAQLEQLGIAPQLRAENLEVEDFAKIANWIHKTRSI